MSPEKLIIDPMAAPVMMGMVVKIKDFVAVKAITVAITIAFSVGIFYSQTNAMIDRVDKFTARLEKVEQAMISLQRSQDIASNDVAHMRSDIDKLTAQFSEIIAYKAKIRR